MLTSYRDPETGLIITSFVCDFCNRPIEDRHIGATVLVDDPPGSSPPRPLRHAHRDVCLDQAERELGGCVLLWQEMSDTPAAILTALDMTLVDVADRELTWEGSNRGSCGDCDTSAE
jgi:hypothetical protein